MVGYRFLVGPIPDFTLGSLEDHVRVGGFHEGRKGTGEKPFAADHKEREC